MMYAVKNNERIPPEPQGRAVCPACHDTVIARCGNVNMWHWAHQKGFDCDDWYEPESEWHRNWSATHILGLRPCPIFHNAFCSSIVSAATTSLNIFSNRSISTIRSVTTNLSPIRSYVS